MHLLANRLSFFFGIKIHFLFAAELPICSRNTETLKTVSRCIVSGRFWAFSFDMSGFILKAVSFYRQPFKSRCLSLPNNKKAPYCYDAFVLLGRWSKGTLFNYLLYFFFLLTIVVPMAAPPLMNNRAIHSARLLVSPVWGSLESSFSFAVTVSAFSNASCSAYFVAGVLGIPLVHYVEERGEVVILWFVAVHAVIDCDKAYLLLGEQNLGIKADLKIVSAETAHILDDNRTDFPGFGFCKHCLKSGTVE